MDPSILSEIMTKNESSTQDIDRIKAELSDTKFELEGARNTISRLSAEIHRLRMRYRAASEGDR